MSLVFDRQLYQRGQTWQECRESWRIGAADFLERVVAAPDLPLASAALAAWPRHCRLALYHDEVTLDSRVLTPLMGAGLSRCPRVSLRLFQQDFFFPLFHRDLGRDLPRLLILDDAGHVPAMWGPRPAALDAIAGKGDAAYATLKAEEAAAALDEELADFFQKHAPSASA